MPRKQTMPPLLALAVVLALAAWHVAAHGHLVTPASITGTVDARVNQNGLDNCGVAAADKATVYEAGRNSPSIFMPGQLLSMTYQVTNADGAGPLTLAIDESGTGASFTRTVPLISNVPGDNGRLATSPTGKFPFTSTFTARMPNVNCAGPKGLCLMRVIQDQSFATCSFFAQPQPVQQRFPGQFPQFPGQQFPGQQFQQFPGQQFQQFPGQQFPGQQFPQFSAQQFPGQQFQQFTGQQFPGQQFPQFLGQQVPRQRGRGRRFPGGSPQFQQQFPGQQFPGQQFPGQQFNGQQAQQFPGQQFPGQQFNGQQAQQFPGQQFNGQQFPGQQAQQGNARPQNL